MKPQILYIESKQNLDQDFKIPPSQLKKLPKNILLLYSIQYRPLAQAIKTQLTSNKININGFQQVLGCSKISNPKNLPILLISTGKFHAQNLYLQSQEIYLLYNNKITRISNKEINKLKTKRKTALMKFLNAETIGILVSTKLGQENLAKTIKLKKALIKENKQPYIFLANNISTDQFENFQIDAWVNTACPGLAYNNPNIINMGELPMS